MRKHNKLFEKAMIGFFTGCLIVTMAGCGLGTTSENTSEEDVTLEVAENTDGTTSDEKKTDGTTAKKTERETESKTEERTEGTTAGKTERTTEHRTEATTEGKTERTTERRTEGTTERRTEASTEKRTESTTERKTEATTEAPTTEAPSTECQHDWEAVYREVNHPEEGHYEKVMVKPGMIKAIEEYHTVCNGCGFDYTANGVTPGSHECPDGYTASWTTKTIVVGYEEIPPEYEERWIVDKPAWVEKVIDYYKCKKCGKRKQK